MKLAIRQSFPATPGSVTGSPSRSSCHAVTTKARFMFWITSHNAKVMKAGLDANKAPFLPDQNGNIKTEPVYTLSQGYCLPASHLIPVQFEKMKKGYESNIVATRNQIGEAGTELKDGEKGVLYNFKGRDENFHTAAVFFPTSWPVSRA